MIGYIDIIQTLSVVLSLFAIAAWLIRLRRWPLIWAVLAALLTNLLFYVALEFNLMSPVDLNLFSSVRVLIMLCVIAAIPFSVVRR